ncbi:MAG: peptide chain release factor N(5)-glutamine methyltransferase [Myxococcota bacterium]
MKPLVDVLTSTTEYLRARGIPSARLDAELILGHVLGLDRVKVYLNFDRPLKDDELERLRVLVKRRGAREPIAYLLGTKGFHAYDFVVTPGVLVPRPDTEALVEAALAWIEGDPVYVADVGCGTGCIGLTIAKERPGVRLFAVDLADAAIAATKANVEALGLKERVAVLRGDLLAPIPPSRAIDWVVSNPPYVPSADIAGLEPEVRDHEPRLALDGGPDGLDAYRRLVPVAAQRARMGVLVEVGAGQAPAVAHLMRAAGLAEVETRKDLAGIERVVAGRR